MVAVPDDAAMALSEASYAALCDDLEDDEVNAGDGVAAGDDSAFDSIRVCADSFEEFAYRFWLEDEISFKLLGLETTPLTDAEREYLAHYTQLREKG